MESGEKRLASISTDGLSPIATVLLSSLMINSVEVDVEVRSAAVELKSQLPGGDRSEATKGESENIECGVDELELALAAMGSIDVRGECGCTCEGKGDEGEEGDASSAGPSPPIAAAGSFGKGARFGSATGAEAGCGAEVAAVKPANADRRDRSIA